ncbi:MAG: type II toxin-antitoxin system VapC family toxin [Syntrophus sp. (in: bacteria)]
MNRVVLDASVILKWYLPDELYGKNALDLLEKFTIGTLDVAAPTLLEYELVNALMFAGKRGRLGAGAVMTALEGFKCLGIPLLGPAGHYDRIIYYCHTYARSAYDGSYLALAERESRELVTADERLFNGVKAELPWVRWIGDLQE